MQNRVSIRDTKAPRNVWRSDARNSEANGAGDAVQLLPLWPRDLGNRTAEGRKKLVAVIERELRKERQRGIAGSTAYNVSRHAKLARLLKDERRSLARLELSLFGKRSRGGAKNSDQRRER